MQKKSSDFVVLVLALSVIGLTWMTSNVGASSFSGPGKAEFSPFGEFEEEPEWSPEDEWEYGNYPSSGGDEFEADMELFGHH